MKANVETVESVIERHKCSGKFIDVGGVRTFVIDVGFGPAVLCLHGVPTSSFLYRKVLPALRERGLRAIAFDYPGLGLSDRPRQFDYSFNGLSRFVLDVINTLKLESFHLVVHDIGGPIGFAAAGEVPDKIRSITILNTWLEVDKFRKPLPMRPFGWPGIGRVQLKLVSHYTWHIAFKLMAVHNMTGITTEEVYAYVDLLKREDDGIAFLKIMRSFDHSFAFKKRCYKGVVNVFYPVQVIWGVDDPGLTYDRYGMEIDRVVRPKRFYTLHTKHLLQEDCWREIADKVAVLATP